VLWTATITDVRAIVDTRPASIACERGWAWSWHSSANRGATHGALGGPGWRRRPPTEKQHVQDGKQRSDDGKVAALGGWRLGPTDGVSVVTQGHPRLPEGAAPRACGLVRRNTAWPVLQLGREAAQQIE